ncbi:MAG: hypothetical protein ACXWC4_16255 [Telluria sp.]
MEEILVALLQILGEIVLQVAGEALAELGMHGLSGIFERRPHAWLAAIGYVTLGSAVGWISALIVPALIASPALRVANLAITPLVAGATTSLIGSWRRRREQELVRLDRFAYGYLFALSMALVRLWLAE